MAADHTVPGPEPEPILRVRGLSKQYGQRHWFNGQKFLIQALRDVEFTICAGSTLALVGESGAGKSTLARCLARLEDPDSGEIWYRDKNLLALPAREMRWVRQQIQLIFQDPTSALNPRFTAVEIVAEPLAIQRRGTKEERHRRALEAMEQVGLPRDCGNKSPLELSGGERQRLALVRALELEPKFLILDEALAGLDLSIQAQIVNLLLELQISRGLTYLYISHDLTMVGHIADQVAVMRDGRIIESSQTSDFFTSPRHPYTQGLIASTPRIESRA
jgi:ABC-type glutathione transport system ATPase component